MNRYHFAVTYTTGERIESLDGYAANDIPELIAELCEPESGVCGIPTLFRGVIRGDDGDDIRVTDCRIWPDAGNPSQDDEWNLADINTWMVSADIGLDASEPE